MTFSALELRNIVKVLKFPITTIEPDSSFNKVIQEFYTYSANLNLGMGVNLELENEVRATLVEILELEEAIKALETNDAGLIERWSVYQQYEIQRQKGLDPTVLLKRRKLDLTEDLGLLLGFQITDIPGRTLSVPLLRS